jgi:ATP-dependent DNA ligase
MASKSITIKDTAQAIKSGEIPGAFSEDRKKFNFPVLKSKGTRGVNLIWQVSVSLEYKGTAVAIDEKLLSGTAQLPDSFRGVISVSSKQEETKNGAGKERAVVPTYVTAGKNIGKKNATNVVTQAIRDALSLHNKHAKKANNVEADQKKVNPFVLYNIPGGEKMDFQPPPMLVQKPGDTAAAKADAQFFGDGALIQRKYNGVRVVCYLDPDNKVIMYSRAKGEYPGHEQIRTELAEMLKRAPKVRDAYFRESPAVTSADTKKDTKSSTKEPDKKAKEDVYSLPNKSNVPIVYIDGEIYEHGKPLQWISGQSRKKNDEGTLSLHVYDCFFPVAIAKGYQMPSLYRQEYLREFFSASGAPDTHPHIKQVFGDTVHNLEEANAKAKEYIAEGYEGGIIRKAWAGYQYSYNNKHSANLLKIKPILDSEFKVIDFTQGDKGKDVGALIWVCEVDEKKAKDQKDRVFNVVPKDMTYQMRYALFKCLSQKVPSGGATSLPQVPGAMTHDQKMITRFERDLKGLYMTVEYPELSTKTGKPVQAKALTFRTYEGGPDKDPYAKILAECKATK